MGFITRAELAALRRQERVLAWTLKRQRENMEKAHESLLKTIDELQPVRERIAELEAEENEHG